MQDLRCCSPFGSLPNGTLSAQPWAAAPLAPLLPMHVVVVAFYVFHSSYSGVLRVSQIDGVFILSDPIVRVPVANTLRFTLWYHSEAPALFT